ncbi:MAG: glycosyltransferase family 2 protein [Candidatus Coatesbacteria bacterium]|nr:MAG: glycosyltransferase family 2 protein [Candidatus Coatesbacteria bacterium]
MTSPPLVSAITVSYNCADLLREALTSLLAQEPAGGLEVIVVDNASADDGVAVARSFTGVEVMALDRNVGFGAANNLAAARASGQYLLFVNPDVVVPAGVAEELASFLEGRPQAAAAGPALVGRDGRLQRFCARRFPSAANLIFLVSGIGETRWGGSALAHRYYPQSYYGRGPARADVLAGACMMVQSEVFNAVGGFDEAYFLYAEDVDLCRRLADAGGEVWYLPAGPVRHYTGGSRRTPAPLVVAASHLSTARYAERWHGRAAASAVRLVSRVSLATRRWLFAALGAFSGEMRRRARFYADVIALRRERAGASD